LSKSSHPPVTINQQNSSSTSQKQKLKIKRKSKTKTTIKQSVLNADKWTIEKKLTVTQKQ
jgi:hypothetical protein